MNIEQIEDDIAAQLAGIVTDGVEVITLPQTAANFNRDVDDARLTIAFNGVSGDDTKSTNEVNQNFNVTTGIVIQARLLRGDKGAYTLFNKVRKALVGFTPTGCGRMKFKSFDLYSDEADVFTFVAFFSCDLLVVENFSESATPILSRLQIDNDVYYNPSTVIP